MPKVYRLGMASNPSNGATNSVYRTNDPMPAAHRSPTYSNYSLTEGSHNGNATPISALETPHNAEEVRIETIFFSLACTYMRLFDNIVAFTAF